MENLIFIVIASLAFLFGFYVVSRPKSVISLQQKIYTYVNWRMEPISMPKEIVNTRLMGLFLIAVTLIICIYYCLR